MKTFLHIGTDYIFPEVFQNIRNTNKPKPIGGLWATKHSKDFPLYNEWMEFLTWHPYLLFYKKNNGNPDELPAIYITLKDSANIFKVENVQQLNFLLKYYPDGKGWIDFESLAEDFEGIFFDLHKTCSTLNDSEIKSKLKKYDVSSLIIFNPNCIDYYQKAKIDIDLFYYEYENEFNSYTITIDSEKIKIGTPLPECQNLIAKIRKYAQECPDTTNLSSKIKSVFASELETTIKAIEEQNKAHGENIQRLLIRKSIHGI